MYLVVLIVYFVLLFSCGRKAHFFLNQIDTNLRYEINEMGILHAKNILLKDCKIDPNPIKLIDGTLTNRKQFGIYTVDSLTFVPISLFKISSKAITYEGANITDFLIWKKRDLVGFLTFKNEEFEGLLDWSDVHNYHHYRECQYYTVQNSSFTINNSYWLGYKYLIENNRDTGFLFGVKYFLETIWFIEEGKVYLLDLKTIQVYDPDEFIKLKCYEGFIKDIAKGGFINCNY